MSQLLIDRRYKLKTMSVSNKRKAECCGCNACAEICPKHCIHMVEDTKGFLYPQVDSSICVECGACEKVCPIDTAKSLLMTPLKAFAAWNKNRKEHLSSSSGGAAYVLSSHILDTGGVIYGCTANGIDVRHIRIDNKSELYKLQGSKYVQSDVRGLFKNVKDDLKNGKSVLFIGTPCQVAGLKNYIGGNVEHLYLVDLICHGVPSQKMLHDHIKHVAKERKIQYISFRKGNDFTISLKAPGFIYDANVWREPHKDLYMKGFMDGMTYRPSCYKCPFACSRRASDITIGDFWGLGTLCNVKMNKGRGMSEVLLNTEKGISFFEVCGNLCYFESRNLQEAIDGNGRFKRPSERHPLYYQFQQLYVKEGFTQSCRKCLRRDYKYYYTSKLKQSLYSFFIRIPYARSIYRKIKNIIKS